MSLFLRNSVSLTLLLQAVTRLGEGFAFDVKHRVDGTTCSVVSGLFSLSRMCVFFWRVESNVVSQCASIDFLDLLNFRLWVLIAK